MKHFTRFLCLFFAAAMLLTMAACGSKNTDTDTDTKTGSEKKQLVVATSPDFPPFESLDGSDIVGIEPKLMQAGHGAGVGAGGFRLHHPRHPGRAL